MKGLKGKAVIVTGGTSGIGEGVAKYFAEAGSNIIINGRDKIKGDKVAKEVRDNGGECTFVQGDITEFDTNRLLVDTALQKYGRLDVLIPCAGVLGVGSVTETTKEQWDYTVAANLNSVFYLCNIGLTEIMKTGGGSVIVISSIAAYKNFPNHPAYCASKAGVVAFVKQMALDYGPKIRANIICPGQVDTPLLWDSTKAFDNPQEIVDETAQKMPLKRIGKPIDIAKAAAFLASSDSEWITGCPLIVDGGSLLI